MPIRNEPRKSQVSDDNYFFVFQNCFIFFTSCMYHFFQDKSDNVKNKI